MEISRLYINIYVTINARVVWLFSFVHGAPPPKRAPWYLQCAAWLETSSRRASLDLLSKCTERIARVVYGKKTSGYNLVFQMSNKEMKNWKYTTPQQLVQVMYILRVQISPGNFQTSHNFSLETSKLPTTFFGIFRSKVRFHGTTEHCHGPPDHLWNASIELGSQQPWILMEIYHSQLLGNDMMKYCCGFVLICHMCGCWYPCQDEEKTLYSHASTGAMNHTTVVSTIWALGVFHAIQEGCYISYCRKWYQPNIKQPTHGIAGNNANKMHNAHFVSNI